FVFDNQMLTQCLYFGFRVGEVSCPTSYFPEASSISFGRSVTYGVGVIRTSLQCALQRLGLGQFSIFNPTGRRIEWRTAHTGEAGDGIPAAGIERAEDQ
ncbi:MAG TPA: hypothetical protein VHI99_20805, partial [Vicinamibacterales bacterium]|nr:hypothetical protein [Vicinamibacterales bacterium]